MPTPTGQAIKELEASCHQMAAAFEKKHNMNRSHSIGGWSLYTMQLPLCQPGVLPQNMKMYAKNTSLPTFSTYVSRCSDTNIGSKLVESKIEEGGWEGPSCYSNCQMDPENILRKKSMGTRVPLSVPHTAYHEPAFFASTQCMSKESLSKATGCF